MSNFAVAVAVARIGGIAALGAFSVAYVAWALVAEFHRSLVTDPMTIENDLSGSEAKRALRLGVAAELWLGLGVAVVAGTAGGILLACGQRTYGAAFLAVAPWIPCLLLQDYWRWVAFMQARPGRALLNDVAFDAVEALSFGVLLVTGSRSSVMAIGAWALGALAGAVLGFVQQGVLPRVAGGVGRLRERWAMSRWLLSGSLTMWGAFQGFVVLAAAIVGPVGMGGLRAASNLVSGPSLVLVQAGGSIGLPEASRALSRRGWPGLRRVERAVTTMSVASVVAIGLVVLVWGRQLLVLLYGSEFARFATTADLFAVSVLLSTFSVGAVLALKAVKLTEMVFHKSLVTLVVSLVAVAVLAPIFGVQGAAGAAVARGAALSLSTLVLHWRFSRSAAEELQAGTAPEGGQVRATIAP